ncbi:MAG: hypothetical protein HYR96_05800, partial [Deltaproteobacteria bacterium]|nr:hypothetical protein [Deltaproteobacteria bacterium]
MKRILFSLMVGLSLFALAETADTPQAPQTPAQSVATAAVPASEFFGFFELRPSWITKMGEEHTENTIEAGYRLGGVKMSYLQWFNTNIFNPTTEAQGAGEGNGLALIASQGLFRVKVADVWKSADQKTSLAYQGRVYLPTWSGDRDTGMLTQVRNYLTLKTEVSSLLTLDGSIVPIFHGSTRAGTVASSGSLSANPIYENMVILEATFNFTDKLSLAIPLILEQTRYRDFAPGAKNNDAWAY